MHARPYTLKTQNRFLPVEFEKELNPEQQAVVASPGGPTLVLAGAGSGKTRVLTYRVAYLVRNGVPPETILLVTFTNKAAREMMARVKRLLGGEPSGLWGGTFHHVGNRILRRYADILGFPNSFAILDREDSKFLMQDCAAETGVKAKSVRFPKADVLQDLLSYSVNCGKNTAEVAESRYPYYLEILPDIETVFRRYEARKQAAALMDFDDLLTNWHKLLVNFPAVREKISASFGHILVDEYQDTNWLQARLLAEMSGAGKNILVVGDDAQSIYSFRGAVFQNILDFPARHLDARVYKLETNYRSTPQILDLANAVIAKNEKQFKKELKGVRENGMFPALVPAANPEEQAAFIAQRILELRDEGYGLSDMAVLYRAHYQSAELELELMRRNIPYEIRSGLRFFEQAHIKDVLAFLRAVQNPKDELSWKRVFRTMDGVGQKTAQKLWEKLRDAANPRAALEAGETALLLRKGGKAQLENVAALFSEMEKSKESVAQCVSLVLPFYDDYLKSSFPDYRERKMDLEELAQFSLRYDSLEKFLSDVALQDGLSGEDILTPAEEEEGAVVLSTIHRAKGLEWRAVFVPWLSEGHFPLAYAYGDADAVEEERRLFYVAITRAKDQVYLLYPRFTREAKVIHRPSPYLSEIPEDLFEQWILQDEKPEG